MIILRHQSNRHWLFCDPIDSKSFDYIVCNSRGDPVKRHVLENVNVNDWIKHKVDVEGWVMELRGLDCDLILLEG